MHIKKEIQKGKTVFFLQESSGILKAVRKGHEAMLIKIKSESGRVAVNVRTVSW